MKTFAKIKFWSLLGAGMLFLYLGTFFFITGRASQGAIEALFIAGLGQLTIFYILLFLLFKDKLKKLTEK
jgi:hypothetical protein